MTVSHDDTHVGSPALRAVKGITFGSIAGVTSKVFEHPFDLTKVRLQLQVLDASARFKGPLDCLVRTFQEEGVRGLYRGLPAPVVGAMVENASLFMSYSQLQRAIRWTTGRPPAQDLPLAQLGLAGAGAGAVTSFVLTPIGLVKCKMQVQMLAVDVHGTSDPARSGSATTSTTPLAAAWFACKELVGTSLVQRRAPRAQGHLALGVRHLGRELRPRRLRAGRGRHGRRFGDGAGNVSGAGHSGILCWVWDHGGEVYTEQCDHILDL